MVVEAKDQSKESILVKCALKRHQKGQAAAITAPAQVEQPRPETIHQEEQASRKTRQALDDFEEAL